MRKVKLISVLAGIFILSSCSVFRRTAADERKNINVRTEQFLEDVNGRNVTNKGFRFDRIRVVMNEGGETRRFTVNIRSDSEGKMLVSVRIIASIEVARIYIDKNKIIILDRLNRIYSEGETREVIGKYGLSWDIMPFLFGDLPSGAGSGERVRCIGGKASLILNLGKDSYVAGFDCLLGKLTDLRGTIENNSISMNFEDFIASGNAMYPENIRFREDNAVMTLDMSLSGYSEYTGIVEPLEKPSRYDTGRLR
ncbi:MAG: DUF4292 domain-containing protein [Bacteroidales bacterium]|nr:DUF4292 domain-containing protein [Bacteroidales bacterium]